jgi:hypothetical protein
MLVAALIVGGLTDDDVTKLRNIHELFEVSDRLEAQDVPTLSQQDKAILLAEASKIAGEDLDRERLEQLSTTLWNKLAGLFTFINVVWITAAICVVAGVAWLFGLHFLRLIIPVPAHVWEIIIWGICALLVVFGSRITPEAYAMWLVFPGCLGMIGAMMLTQHIHRDDEDIHRDDEDITPHAFFLWALWALIALLYNSQLIGFLSVGAFLTAAGFACGMYPMCVWMGFQKESKALTGTAITGLAWVLYLVSEGRWPDLPEIQPFMPGLAFLGTFAYFLGLLIISSKWYLKYVHHTLNHYMPLQALVVISGGAALYFGNLLSLPAVAGVGGAFFYIWLIEKYLELCETAKVHVAWGLLFLGILLYMMAYVATQNPEYFIFMPNG